MLDETALTICSAVGDSAPQINLTAAQFAVYSYIVLQPQSTDAHKLREESESSVLVFLLVLYQLPKCKSTGRVGVGR